MNFGSDFVYVGEEEDEEVASDWSSDSDDDATVATGDGTVSREGQIAMSPPFCSNIGKVFHHWFDRKEGRKEMFYLTTHSTHFIYGYMASDIWLRTILIVRKETRCRHIDLICVTGTM